MFVVDDDLPRFISFVVLYFFAKKTLEKEKRFSFPLHLSIVRLHYLMRLFVCMKTIRNIRNLQYRWELPSGLTKKLSFLFHNSYSS